jgi:hypothetical protein
LLKDFLYLSGWQNIRGYKMQKKLYFIVLFFIFNNINADFKIDWQLPKSLSGNESKIKILLMSTEYSDIKDSTNAIYDSVLEIDSLLDQNNYKESLLKFKGIEPKMIEIEEFLINNINNLNNSLKKCNATGMCDDKIKHKMLLDKAHYQEELSVYIQHVLNYIYFKIGDILYLHGDFANANKYYEKNEKLCNIALTPSFTTYNRPKYSYVLINALKIINFDLKKYKALYNDSFIRTFGTPLIGDLDNDGLDEIITQDIDSSAYKTGIIVTKFFNNERTKFKIYHKTIKARYIDIKIRKENNRNILSVSYEEKHRGDLRKSNIDVEREGAYYFQDGLKVEKDFESAESEDLFKLYNKNGVITDKEIYEY